MLLKIILNYLFGYLNITIEGFFIERFINICSNKKIFLWSLKKKNSSILNANISINNFKKIKAICRKTKCKVKINKKRGIPFIFEKYKKRKIFLLLIAVLGLIMIISSMYIWNIEIIGTEEIDKTELLTNLKEKGLDIGKLKNKIDTKNIISNIRLERNDISWMEINLKGTNAIVSVVKAESKPEIIDDNKYCDIVSNKRGIIEKITAERGTILVKKGDIVEAGTKLIGGYMEGKYTDIRYVHSKGEVIAKVWYTKREKSKFSREEVEETGNVKTRYSIILNNFKINLYKSIPNFEKYDTINENKKLRIFSNFYLPITIEKNTYKELCSKQVTYGKTDLQNIMISELEEKFKDENINSKDIKNKIVNTYQENENELEVELTYEVIENIGIEQPINER